MDKNGKRISNMYKKDLDFLFKFPASQAPPSQLDVVGEILATWRPDHRFILTLTHVPFSFSNWFAVCVPVLF